MKIAYLIIAHKNFDHLALLIEKLSNERTFFFIHIDAKSDFNVTQFMAMYSNKFSDNIHFLENRTSVNWGGFSVFKCMFSLIAYAVQIGIFDYVSLISGQDFPLKSPNEILSYLEDNKGSEFVNYHMMPFPDWPGNGGVNRYQYYWMVDQLGWENSELFVKQQVKENVVRQLPLNLTPYGGAMWFTLTGDCCKYIYNYLLSNREILDFFQYTMIADELILATIIMNSPFRDKVVNNNLRFVEWSGNKVHPKTFSISDLDILLESNCHIARKFDPHFDSEIISRLALKIQN